jgi:hypothetical protein
MKLRLRKPSPAMVVSCLALSISLSGVAYAAGLAPNSVGTRQLKDNAVVSSKVDNRSLKAVDIAAGQLTRARFNANVCNPSTGGGDLTCSTLTMSLPTSGRVLLVAAGSWHETGAADGSVLGHCFIYADASAIWTASYGQKTATFEDGSGGGSPFSGTVAMTIVTDPLSAGSHTFRVDCRENEADITFNTALSAVVLGAS